MGLIKTKDMKEKKEPKNTYKVKEENIKKMNIYLNKQKNGNNTSN